MTDESAPESRVSVAAGGVIKPWLSAILIITLAGNLLLSGVLIVKLSRFDDTKRQTAETEAQLGRKRTELSALQVEVDSLTRQRESLADTVADWEKRLKDKVAAEATLATLQEKQHQIESEIAQAHNQLDETTRNRLEAEQQKSDLATSIERLKSEFASLTVTNNDVKALLNLATEAERRLGDATNAVVNASTRRKQLESDADGAQGRFDQLQKETDDLRQTREKLNTEVTALRQQVQEQKDQLAAFDVNVAEFKTLQSSVHQAEQQLAKLRQQSATAEARAEEMEIKASELASLTNRLEEARSQSIDLQTKRDTTKADLQNAEADLATTRKLSQEFTAKHGELVREVSSLEAVVERLKKEKEALEKEVGRLEGQQQKSAPSGQQ